MSTTSSAACGARTWIEDGGDAGSGTEDGRGTPAVDALSRRDRPFKPRVSLLFDFDETLGTHSIETITAELGLSSEEWKERFVAPLGGGWDEIPLHGQAFIDAGLALGRPVSRALLREAAGRTRLYDGVETLPERLREAARKVDGRVELEFCVLSSGFHTLIAATKAGELFDRIYASQFHFDADDHAVCIKRAVTHAGKALYLEAHAKGLLETGEATDIHMKAARPVPQQEWRVPLGQVIYCGDGESDLQTFALLGERGGQALAIAGGSGFEPGSLTREERPLAVLPPSYEEGGETARALVHAVKSAAHRASVRGVAIG